MWLVPFSSAWVALWVLLYPMEPVLACSHYRPLIAWSTQRVKRRCMDAYRIQVLKRSSRKSLVSVKSGPLRSPVQAQLGHPQA